MSQRDYQQDLRAFAESGDQRAFARVVEGFGGLVYASALRRTGGDRESAEEVAQNVFAVAARKAGALAGHAALTGWFYTTVRLEAAKALRARHRHQRRVEALADEVANGDDSMTTDEQARWREAVPLLEGAMDRLGEGERVVLLGRYFEGRSFAELAAATGSTEGACKMRAKRAVEKLRGWLAASGVRLPAGVLAAGLASELAKPLPAAVGAALPGKALAAAGGVSGFELLSNTIGTMSASKTTGLAVAAVLLLAAVPLGMQGVRIGDLRQQLVERRGSVVEVVPGPASTPGAGGAGSRGATPVARLLASMRRPVDVEALVAHQVSWTAIPDYGKMVRLRVSLAMLSDAERARLLEELEAHPAAAWMGETGELLSVLQGQDADPAVALDQKLKDGVHPELLEEQVAAWAAGDVEGAVAWLEAKRASGELLPKGTKGKGGERPLLKAVFRGVLVADEAAAMDLLEGEAEGVRRGVMRDAAMSWTRSGEGRERALGWIQGLKDDGERQAAAAGAAWGMYYLQDADATAAFVKACGLDAATQAEVLGEIVVYDGKAWGERVAWIESQVGIGAREAVARTLAFHSSRNGDGTFSAWIDKMEAGAERDVWLAAEVGALSEGVQWERALERVAGISDVSVREALTETVVERFAARDPEAVERYLSGESEREEEGQR